MLTLYFSEPLEQEFSDVQVEDQKGNKLTDHVEFDPSDKALMRVYLKPIEPGYLAVNWQTVSSVDGHRIEGSYPLTILEPDGSEPPGTAIQATSNVSGTGANPGRVDNEVPPIAGRLRARGLTCIPGLGDARHACNRGGR